MFENYLATETDLETIEEGLKTVWKPELNFVFRKKELIASTVAVSYDSKQLYLWLPIRQRPGQYRLRKILHNITIPPEYHRGWHAGVWEKIEKRLPPPIRKASRLVIPHISGGLLKPFITLQKDKRLDVNPYTTKESYLATIVHEFGHIYWEQHRLWWHSNKMDNLRLLRLAHNLYLHPRIKNTKANLYLPTPYFIGELFAFCSEYTASDIFWPKHKIMLDKFGLYKTKSLIFFEKNKNLGREDSVIEASTNPHDFASVYGKIILSQYPTTWPQLLTHSQRLGGLGGPGGGG